MIPKKNKMDVIENCLYTCVNYCESYSSFLCKSLLGNLNSFFESNKTRYITNINSNLDGIIKKINDTDKYTELQNELRDIVLTSKEDKYITDSYVNTMYKIINSNNIKDLFNALLKEYISFDEKDKVVRLPKLRKKDTSIILPKVNTDIVRKLSYSYIGDELYEHISSGKSVNVINNDSIMYEKELYDESLSKGVLSLYNDLNKYEMSKLSSFEKKRRIYVKSMFKIDMLLNNLNDIEDYYCVSSLLVDNLYSDINTFFDDKNILDNLDKIMKEIYSSKKQLEIYKNKSNSFIKNTKIYKVNKSNKYSMFSNITKVIPTYFDIINVLNNRIIFNISSNIDLYLDHIDTLVEQVCMYMNTADVIKFYQEIRNVLINKKMLTKLIMLSSLISDDNILSNILVLIL